MDINKELEKIFNNDDLNLLNDKQNVSNHCTANERLSRSFEDINEFIDKHGKVLELNTGNVLERCLYYRLKVF